MANLLYTGAPRSGKTYLAVYKIATELCLYSDGEYFLKKNILLIHNIDGLSVGITIHELYNDFFENSKINVESRPYCTKCQNEVVSRPGAYGQFYYCKSCKLATSSKKPEKVNENIIFAKRVKTVLEAEMIYLIFKVDFFKKLRVTYPKDQYDVWFYIDEAQRYFPRTFYDRDVLYAFEYHGHYGVNITFITQHVSLISRDLKSVIELETHSIARSRKFIQTLFHYKERAVGAYHSQRDFTLKKNKLIFALYVSAYAKENIKFNLPFRNYLIIMLIMVLFSVSTMYYVFHNIYSRHVTEKVVSKLNNKTELTTNTLGKKGILVKKSYNPDALKVTKVDEFKFNKSYVCDLSYVIIDDVIMIQSNNSLLPVDEFQKVYNTKVQLRRNHQNTIISAYMICDDVMYSFFNPKINSNQESKDSKQEKELKTTF